MHTAVEIVKKNGELLINDKRVCMLATTDPNNVCYFLKEHVQSFSLKIKNEILKMISDWYIQFYKDNLIDQ